MPKKTLPKRVAQPSFCSTCGFFGWQVQYRDDDPKCVSVCRLHAPVIIERAPSGRWPQVKPVHWCGDFRPVADVERERGIPWAGEPAGAGDKEIETS